VPGTPHDGIDVSPWPSTAAAAWDALVGERGAKKKNFSSDETRRRGLCRLPTRARIESMILKKAGT